MTGWDKILIVAVALAAVGSAVFVRTVLAVPDSEYVSIRSAGRVKTQISLSEDRTVTVRDKDNWCRIRIKDGRAEIVDTNCPNKLCMDQPPVTREGGKIICLPQQLVVETSAKEADGGPDAVIK